MPRYYLVDNEKYAIPDDVSVPDLPSTAVETDSNYAPLQAPSAPSGKSYRVFDTKEGGWAKYTIPPGVSVPDLPEEAEEISPDEPADPSQLSMEQQRNRVDKSLEQRKQWVKELPAIERLKAGAEKGIASLKAGAAQGLRAISEVGAGPIGKMAALTPAAAPLGAYAQAASLIGLAKEPIQKKAQEYQQKSDALTQKYPTEQVWEPGKPLSVEEAKQALTDPTYWLINLPETAISQLPAAVGGVASVPKMGAKGAAWVGGLIGGSQEAASEYEQLRSEGMGPEQAATRAGVFGLVTAALNKLPLDEMFKVADGGVLNKIKKMLVTGTVEAVTEAAEEPIAAVIDTLGREGYGSKEILDRLGQAMRNAVNVLPQAFATGGGMGAMKGQPTPPPLPKQGPQAGAMPQVPPVVAKQEAQPTVETAQAPETAPTTAPEAQGAAIPTEATTIAPPAEQAVEQPVAGEPVAEVRKEEVPSAQGIRPDQGVNQAVPPGDVVEGSEGVRGEGVQRQAPVQPEPVAQRAEAAGEVRPAGATGRTRRYPGVTQEAEDFIASAENGVPAFVSSNLRKIAAENGIEYKNKTPNQILESLIRKGTTTADTETPESPAAPTAQAAQPSEDVSDLAGIKGGVGAAAASGTQEFFGERTVGTHAATTKLREQLRMKPRTKQESQSDAELQDAADDAYFRNPNVGAELVQTMQAKPDRAATDLEHVILLTEMTKALSTLNAAKSASIALAKTGTKEQVAQNDSLISDTTARLESILELLERSGSAWGRSGRARRLEMDAMFNVFLMERQMVEQQKGKDLSASQRAEIEAIKAKYDERIEKLEKRIAELMAESQGNDDVLAEAQARIKLQELVATKPKAEKETTAREDAKPKTDSAWIKSLFREQVEAGTTDYFEVLDNVTKLVQAKKPNMTKEQVRDTFSDYGKARQLSRTESDKIMSDLRRQAQLYASIERVQKQLAPLKSGPQRDKPTPKVRELTRQLHKLMKEAGITTTDSDAKIKGALDAIKSRLRNAIEDLNKALDAHTKLVKDTAKVEYDQEANALKDERDRLKAQYDEMFPAEEATPEERLEKAINAAQRSLEYWDQRVRDARQGKFTTAIDENRQPLPPSARLEEIKSRRDAAKNEFQTLKSMSQDVRITELKKRMERTIADLRKRIASGTFTRPKREEVNISQDPEALRLQTEVNKARDDFAVAKERARRAARTWDEVAKETALDIYGAVRDLTSSYDVSAIGRQGFYFILSHPYVAMNGISKMIKASKQGGSAQAAQELHERPNYKDGTYKRADLGLMNDDGTGNFTSVEDRFKLTLLRRVPGIQLSNRWYATFLNTIRADYFDMLLKNTANPNDKNPEKIKALAEGVNILTGRGKLQFGKARLDPQTASYFLWAPRFLKSALDILTVKPLRGGGETFKLFGKEYLRMAASLAGIYAIAGMFAGDDEEDKIEWDVRSSRFGAFRVPGTSHYINPIGYVRPLLNYLARTATGVTVGTAGQKRKLRAAGTFFDKDAEEKTKFGEGIWDTTWRFIVSKLHPGAGALGTLVAQESPFGFDKKPPKAKDYAALAVPLNIRQAWEKLQIEDEDAAIALMLLSSLGVEVSPDYNSPEYMKHQAGSVEEYEKLAGKIFYAATSKKATPAQKARAQKLLQGVSAQDRKRILQSAIKAQKENPYTAGASLRIGRLRKLSEDASSGSEK